MKANLSRGIVIVAILLACIATAVVQADDIANTADNTIDATYEQVAATVGGDDVSVGLAVNPTNGDGKSGCNLTGPDGTVTVRAVSSDPSVATVSPSTVTFGPGCGGTPSLTIHPVSAGTADIVFTEDSQTAASARTFDVSGADFTVTVSPAVVANTPPEVSVTGVANGGSYTKGSVPTPGCSVTDAEDGPQTVSPDVSAVTGPYAADGIGQQTVTCTYTDTGGARVTASATYAIVDATPPDIDYTLAPAAPDGDNGWWVSDVSLRWLVDEPDSPSSLVLTGCVDQLITSDQAETTYSCSATSAGGSAGPVDVSIKRDATAPTLSPSVSPNPVVLGGSASASPNASDATSRVASASCDSVATSTVGLQSVRCSATDNAGNEGSAPASYSVVYSTGACLGSPGHQVLQPVNVDGSSVFKLGSTVPVKFRVCDINGSSIGSAGVVASLKLVAKLAGGVSTAVNEDPVSTSSDTAFRWDPAAQQWIFNLSTKGLLAGTKYTYDITLNDGSVIEFKFGVK